MRAVPDRLAAPGNLYWPSAVHMWAVRGGWDWPSIVDRAWPSL